MAKKSKPKSKPAAGWAPKYMCSAMDLDNPASAEVLAARAAEHWPGNLPILLSPVDAQPMDDEQRKIARVALTTRWWGPEKTKFVVGFMDSVTPAVADLLVKYFNAWKDAPSAIEYVWTNDVNAADFRLAFEKDGYWSYVGVDCKSIPKSKPTMNLQGMNTTRIDEREWMRVIPHEGGHGKGMPHEHQRKEIVDLLDPAGTKAEFRRTNGWSGPTVEQQILTPLKESALHAKTAPDVKSLMCYWFSAACTKSGNPIPGGLVLSALDKQFAAKMWPTVAPPPPPPDGKVITWIDGKQYRVVAL